MTRVAALDIELRDAGDDAVIAPLVDAAVADGYAAGYAHGYAEGREVGENQGRAAVEAADAVRAAAVDRALAAVAAAADEWERREATALAAVEEAVIDAALTLAEAIVGRELALAERPGRDALVRALALAPERGVVRARLNPEDVATLGDPAPAGPGRDIMIVPDDRVERGGCVVDVGDSRIDAQLAPAVERVREALGR